MSPLFAALFVVAPTHAHQGFTDTIERVESMVYDSNAQSLVQRQGLSLVNVTWEDTGRYKNSVWGPNISDMTIGVRDRNGALHPMPVIRFDNFHDRTADVDSDAFWLKVGNARGQELRAVSLADVLQNTRAYLHDSASWGARHAGLWTARDEEVLVSAQAALLPIPRQGKATFTPVIYNYQSYPGNPAVLTIVATREGTSVQVVENRNGYMSEPLFFNMNGERAPFEATRLSDFNRNQGGPSVGANSPEAAGLSAVLVIQVPLKHQAPRYDLDIGDSMAMEAPMPSAPPQAKMRSTESAVVSHGKPEGPFAEVRGLSIERDTRFPVRVTVQFYQATTSGTLTQADVVRMKRLIDGVYAQGNRVGSLVTQGPTGRATEWVPETIPEVRWANPGFEW